jgi:hypothetical protein
VLQSSAKNQLYSSVYNITLNPISVAQRICKKIETMWKIGLEDKLIVG